MDAPLFAEIQRHSFSRTPAWRWERARWLISHEKNFSARRDDFETKSAMNYLRAWNRYRPERRSEKMAREFPDLHSAHCLHDEGGPTRLEVQARLLARQTPEVIAEYVNQSAEVIRSYECTFFHIIDRFDFPDWIVSRAIGWWSFDPAKGRDRATVLRAFAYWGGIVVLNAVLPYLIDGQGWETLMDHPSSADSLHEENLRLAILTAMLPMDEKTDRKLLSLGVSVREMTRMGALKVQNAFLEAAEVAKTLDRCSIETLQKLSNPIDATCSEEISHDSQQCA